MLAGQDQGPSAAQAVKGFADSLPEIVELRSSREPGIKLVRPDGYLAYSADPHSEKASLQHISEMRSLLERQTKPDHTHAAGA